MPTRRVVPLLSRYQGSLIWVLHCPLLVMAAPFSAFAVLPELRLASEHSGIGRRDSDGSSACPCHPLWDRVTIDQITQLPSSQAGLDATLVVGLID